MVGFLTMTIIPNYTPSKTIDYIGMPVYLDGWQFVLYVQSVTKVTVLFGKNYLLFEVANLAWRFEDVTIDRLDFLHG
jgi:hypothetical protein